MAEQVLYRLRCGRRVWSRWLDDEQNAWRIAVQVGLASVDSNGRRYSGPLVWIEKGLRRRPKTRTIPMTAELDGKPLRPIHRNPLASG